MPRFSWLLVGAGWLFTGLGIAGIFVPLLPTVPLLLLAAACFARSSPRCYAWLLDHPRLGPLVAGYLDGGGIPLRAKIMAIIMVWLSVSLSLTLAGPPRWVQLVLLCVAAGVTLYLLWLPTRPSDQGGDNGGRG
jgi:uncharacterized membrane protein YbaN (DUF454 family)